MAKGKSKKLKLLKGEKIMYAVIIFLFILIPIMEVYTSSVVTRSNIELEELKSSIEKQKETNESLSMQIDELASIESIEGIAETTGLSYNNGNIKTIDE